MSPNQNISVEGVENCGFTFLKNKKSIGKVKFLSRFQKKCTARKTNRYVARILGLLSTTKPQGDAVGCCIINTSLVTI